MIAFLLAHQADFVLIGTSLVTIASAAANLVKPDSFVGKILHYIALNFKVK